MTTEKQQDDLYTRFKGWSAEGFGHFKKHWAAYYRLELMSSAGAPAASGKRPLRLLEIGFGNGAFLGWARAKGHTVFGVEIDLPQLAASEAAGFQTRNSLEALEASFDIAALDGIVAFDVFEHLTHAQLEALLTKLQRLLKPGGWVLARFPNGDSPFGRLNQHGDLTHVSTIGSVATRQLALASGLRLVSVGSPKTPILRIGPARAGVALLGLAIRFICELPVQMLMNVYHPGAIRWYGLSPNLVARFQKPPHTTETV